MKKLLILAGLCFCTSFVHAQFLRLSDGAFINPVGILGYCKPDGTVQDPSHTTLGYIMTDGTIQNASHAVIGYVKTDGTMQDKSHTTIAYFLTKGILEDASHKMIGQLRTQTEASLKIYFFP